MEVQVIQCILPQTACDADVCQQRQTSRNNLIRFDLFDTKYEIVLVSLMTNSTSVLFRLLSFYQTAYIWMFRNINITMVHDFVKKRLRRNLSRLYSTILCGRRTIETLKFKHHQFSIILKSFRKSACDCFQLSMRTKTAYIC